MTTFQQLINAAQNKGIEFDTYTSRFNNTRGYSEDGDLKTYFGFKNNKNWFWFEGYSEEEGGFNTMFFNGKYYPATGSTYKTWKKENEAFKILGLY